MKKALVVALVAALAATALQAPAVGKKKKAKPKRHVLYLHGTNPSGEAYYLESTANSTGFQVMDTKKPADPAPKSMGITNYVAGPNTSCSGNSLFPTWQGNINGKVSGDLKVFLNAVSPGLSVRVDLFADSTGGCDSSLGSTGYVPPVSTWSGALNAGPAETEIVFKKVNFKAMSNIVIMVTPVELTTPAGSRNDPTSQARILYDSPEFDSRVEFLCAPARGKTCAT
jgi:hypothetical protein